MIRQTRKLAFWRRWSFTDAQMVQALLSDTRCGALWWEQRKEQSLYMARMPEGNYTVVLDLRACARPQVLIANRQGRTHLTIKSSGRDYCPILDAVDELSDAVRRQVDHRPAPESLEHLYEPMA